MKASLQQMLNTKVLIADGAMGTNLTAFQIDHCYEALNLTHPQTILSIHQAYIEAGVDIIQTNTYNANAIKLAAYGREHEVELINKQAVLIAKQATQNCNVFILGAIGGIRNPGNKAANIIPTSQIIQAFTQQINILLAQNVDGILLETYYDVEELKTVLQIARMLTKLPIIAHITMQEIGLAANGQQLNEILPQLVALGANVVGANCHFGPYYMEQSFKDVKLIAGATLSVYPNASNLGLVEGALTYQNRHDYFGQYAPKFQQLGIGLIGGCCGTTPSHIRSLRKHLISTQLLETKTTTDTSKTTTQIKKNHPLKKLEQLVTQQKTVIVELAPPRTLAINDFLKNAQQLQQAGVDRITISDNSLAQPRMSNILLATILGQRLNIKPIIHLTTRDHNILGLTSQIMGMHALNLFDILAITGDPAKIGDFPGASSVFDVSSCELIKLIKNFNHGLSYTGKNLQESSDFSVAAACNPNYRHLSQTINAIKQKIAAGADYIITQPIFDAQIIKNLARALQQEKITIPIFIGIQPLVSSRNAQFLHNEIPGISIPKGVLARMKRAETTANERLVGLDIAKELIDETLPLFQGIYLVTPFALAHLSAELVRYIKS
ncbi:MAG: bifunctional homocysteine S-methyltransferase/methylenetetrahydrofolate reductase [Culicoidibacterales bacterium]